MEIDPSPYHMKKYSVSIFGIKYWQWVCAFRLLLPLGFFDLLPPSHRRSLRFRQSVIHTKEINL